MVSLRFLNIVMQISQPSIFNGFLLRLYCFCIFLCNLFKALVNYAKILKTFRFFKENFYELILRHTLGLGYGFAGNERLYKDVCEDKFEYPRHNPYILAAPQSKININRAKFPFKRTKFALNRALLAI